VSPGPTLGIYVHLPFCPYICPYCDFAKWPHRRSASDRYLRALESEIAATEPVPAATLFFGGGTPNAYDATELAGLIGRLRERFSLPDGAEISVEVNPELVREGDFARYRAAGVTRVSIGVQSFQPAEIATLGRKHTPEQVAAVVAQARAAGMPSVSLDLIFGVPGQKRESWRRDLERAIALGVDHVSTYGLTVEEGTPYAAWQLREPRAFADDALEADLYGEAIDRLEAAGYEQYEISNFAKPGHRCRHNENYWNNGDYVGLGVGAASFRRGERGVHTRDLEEYVAAAASGRPIPSETERLEGARRAGEAAMLSLRTAQGVVPEAFKERYGLDFLTFYASIVEEFRAAGLLEASADRVRLTRRGRFVANDVCAAFVTFG
jgi:oxygen-independent coproporphyrinogen-3 oxidase